MNFISIIFSNIIGIDGLIIVVTLANIFFVGNNVYKMALRTEKVLKRVVYKPLDEILSNIVVKNEEQSIDIHEMKEQREKEDAWYQLFISITSILPLMGILGTVVSLLNINILSQEVISANFTIALSSTFWGIVGAIICRVIEGGLAPIIERNRENFEMLVGKISSNKVGRE